MIQEVLRQGVEEFGDSWVKIEYGVKIRNVVAGLGEFGENGSNMGF